MKFNKETVLLHGGRKIYVLRPTKANRSITAASWGGEYVTIGNGDGYTCLAEIFNAAR